MAFSRNCRKALRLFSWAVERFYVPSLTKITHRREHLFKYCTRKITQVEKALWSSLAWPLLKAGPNPKSAQDAQDLPWSVMAWISPKKETPVWFLHHCLPTLVVKDVSLYSVKMLSFFWAALRRLWLHLLYNPVKELQIAMRSPQPPLLWAEESWLLQPPLHALCSSPWPAWWPLLATFPLVNICPRSGARYI